MEEKTSYEEQLKEKRLDELIERTSQNTDIDISSREEVLDNFRLHGNHNWTQRGIAIECTLCPNHHGFFVPPDVLLKGIDEGGRPILEKINIDKSNH